MRLTEQLHDGLPGLIIIISVWSSRRNTNMAVTRRQTFRVETLGLIDLSWVEPSEGLFADR